MPVKILDIPAELRPLLAEYDTRVVVVGNTGYQMIALAEHQVVRFCQIINSIFGEILNIFSEEESQEVAFGRIVNKFIETGKIPQIVAVILDLDVEEVKQKLTISQAMYILSEAYDQNINLDRLPEGVRKNLGKLTKLFKKDELSQHPTFQDFTIETLMLLEQEQNPSEAVRKIKEAARRHMIVETSTSSSPTSADSPESISTVSDTSGAVLKVEDAPEDTSQSVSGQTVTVQDTQSGNLPA